jgi:hypothetical protein
MHVVVTEVAPGAAEIAAAAAAEETAKGRAHQQDHESRV